MSVEDLDDNSFMVKSFIFRFRKCWLIKGFLYGNQYFTFDSGP